MTEQNKYKADEELINKTPNSFLNHPAQKDNLELMKNWLDLFSSVCKIDINLTGYSENELLNIEESLGFKIPSALRLAYSYIGKELKFLIPGILKNMNMKIVSPCELLIEKNKVIHDYYGGDAWYETDVLIYETTFKGNKPYNGIDIQRDWQLIFHKEWYWQKDHMPLYKEIIVTLVCIAISNMPVIFKSKVKGVGTWKSDEATEKLYADYFKRFDGFEHYGHTLFYNIEHRAFGWFRAGSAIPDILIGSEDRTFAHEFVEKFNLKAKFHKDDLI